MFAVIQTNEQFADICLARNIGNDYFQFYSKPLITSKSIGMKGIYKPSADIIDNTFYLYYTAKDNKDHSLNRMFVTSVKWNQLLKKLEK